jgi:DHA1 family tetracycline resistance protein-like MFS transporter
VFLGRIISGVTGGNISTAQAYIADVTTRENRAKGMGLFGAAFGLGFILGPAIAGILSKFGVAVPFYFAAALSLANTIAVYVLLPESVTKGGVSKERMGHFAEFLETLRHPEIGIVNLTYFLLITAFSIMTYAIVLYTAFTFGYTAEQNGYFFAYVGFMAILGQGVLFGRLVGRFGEAKLAAAGCIMMAAGLFSVPFVSAEHGGLAGLLIGSAFLSFGNAFASPALTSLVSKLSHEHEQGKSLGIMQSSASLARAIGPTIGGFLLNNSLNKVDASTIYRTFWTASGIMFVAFLTAMYFARSVRAKEIF